MTISLGASSCLGGSITEVGTSTRGGVLGVGTLSGCGRTGGVSPATVVTSLVGVCLYFSVATGIISFEITVAGVGTSGSLGL